MDERIVEQIFTIGIQVGVINLAKELGLIDEMVTEQQAHKMHGKKKLDEWRHKRWIVGYPTGNKERSKFYYKRSELEIASRMLDIQNIIPATKINQIMKFQSKPMNEKEKQIIEKAKRIKNWSQVSALESQVESDEAKRILHDRKMTLYRKEESFAGTL